MVFFQVTFKVVELRRDLRFPRSYLYYVETRGNPLSGCAAIVWDTSRERGSAAHVASHALLVNVS